MMRHLAYLILTTLLVSSCSTEETITFNQHVAPIVHKQCAPCHRPGEAGPFNLISYQDVRKKAKMIAEVTQDRYMPPWPADPNYSSFLNQYYLSDEEIEIIQTWVKQGANEGDSTLQVSYPKFTDNSFLGEPDLVLEMTDTVFIPGNNKDLFAAIKIPFSIPKDTFIRAVEFVPGNRKLVHHMNGHMILFQDELKENPFVGDGHLFPDSIQLSGKALADSVNSQLGLLHDDGTYPLLIPSVSNYLPGVLPQVYPEGIGGYYMSKKGAFYLRNMHYGPSPIPSYDISKINVFYADKRPERPIQETQLGTLGVSRIEPEFVIEPEEIKTFRTELYCTIDISILTVNPHMHLLGKSFKAFAIKPDGDTIPLIHIPEWDFRWQFFYTYPKMVHIPKGSTIVAIGTFDNTSENPNNPFDPPRLVKPPTATTNMKTTDEMFQFIFNYLPYQAGDENISLEVDQLN